MGMRNAITSANGNCGRFDRIEIPRDRSKAMSGGQAIPVYDAAYCPYCGWMDGVAPLAAGLPCCRRCHRPWTAPLNATLK
jgi:hypothetical protein